MSDLTFLSAAAMAELVRSKKISPVELVSSHLDQIDRLNPKLNAFVEIHADRAVQAARDAEGGIMRGESTGPLHGVPLSVKSSISVAGMRCEAGSRLRAGSVAREDATLVQRLRSAGAIILGTTNAPELLMAWETDNLLYGRTNNPWDLSCTAGGSSGGEAAAIVSGMSAGGVGSDGGGSIRVPAHFCGICGLKPTPGRIPSTGHFPVSAGPFALIGVVGPMARTVADLKILFDAMQGPDAGDTCSAPVPVQWPNADEIRKLRVAFFEDDGRTPVTRETRAAVRAAAQALNDAGFEVESFQPPGLEEARELWRKYFVAAGGMLLRPLFMGRELEMSPIMKQFLQSAAAEPVLNAATMLDAWVQRDLLRARFMAGMQRHPIFLCPAAAIPAFRHGERNWQVDGRRVEYLDAWSYAEFFNLLGNPAAVIPIARSSQGLPIGVQIVGRPWREEEVLSVAAALEERCEACRKLPLASSSPAL